MVRYLSVVCTSIVVSGPFCVSTDDGVFPLDSLVSFSVSIQRPSMEEKVKKSKGEYNVR